MNIEKLGGFLFDFKTYLIRHGTVAEEVQSMSKDTYITGIVFIQSLKLHVFKSARIV